MYRQKWKMSLCRFLPGWNIFSWGNTSFVLQYLSRTFTFALLFFIGLLGICICGSWVWNSSECLKSGKPKIYYNLIPCDTFYSSWFFDLQFWRYMYSCIKIFFHHLLLPDRRHAYYLVLVLVSWFLFVGTYMLLGSSDVMQWPCM